MKRSIQLGRMGTKNLFAIQHIFYVSKKIRVKKNKQIKKIFMRMCIVEFLVLTCTMFQVYKRATNEHGGGRGGEYKSMNNETNSPRSTGD